MRLAGRARRFSSQATPRSSPRAKSPLGPGLGAALELRSVELSVEPVSRQQLRVGPLLHQPPPSITRITSADRMVLRRWAPRPPDR